MAYIVQSLVADHYEAAVFSHYETAKRFARITPRSVAYHQKDVLKIDNDNRVVVKGTVKPIKL